MQLPFGTADSWCMVTLHAVFAARHCRMELCKARRPSCPLTFIECLPPAELVALLNQAIYVLMVLQRLRLLVLVLLLLMRLLQQKRPTS